MTATRIPDLTAVTAAGTANDDFFVIFDSSTNTTKKILKSELSAMVQTDLGAAALLAKLVTVDGPGSLLDADTLDGLQATAFAQLSGAAFTGMITSTAGLDIIGASTFGKITAGGIKARVQSEDQDGAYTFVLADANTQIFGSPASTVPASVFSKGDQIIIHSDSGDTTINRGSGLTMYFNGTNVSAAYIRPWRSAAVIFDSSTVCRVIGGTTTPPSPPPPPPPPP